MLTSGKRFVYTSVRATSAQAKKADSIPDG